MKTFFLIGFMGSGKSTVGIELARQLSKTFVDTDNYIENRYEQKITHIFQNDGEITFRTFETAALKKVSSYGIVATGGGIVEREENIHTMKSSGSIIYLQTSFKAIADRLKNDEARPLWDSDMEDKIKLYERRIKHYQKHADYTIKTDNKSIDEIVNEIKLAIR